MSNLSKLLIVLAAGFTLVACNGGGSSSSGGGGNGYSGALVESYSASLPGGGTLNTTQNLVFPAESNGTIPLYFNVVNITQNESIAFTIQQTSSSSLQQKDVSAAGANLPTISPTTCNFTLQNESCTLTLSLNNSSAGTYNIIPMVESPESGLAPIPFTNVVPGNYFFGNGTYSIAGTAYTVSNGVCTGISTLPAGAIATVGTTQTCYSVNGGGSPVCSPTPSFFNSSVNLPMPTQGFDSFTSQKFNAMLSYRSNGSLYFYQYEPICGEIYGTYTPQ